MNSSFSHGAWWKHPVVACLLIVGVTLAVYTPAMRAGFIWDDDMFITANESLRTVDGLRVIWTQPADNPHYYPLLMTLFWVMWQLWDAEPAGYHIVTILFHIGAALLLWRTLLRLSVPGAFWAAMLFALHPVHVQSVAWATELKNTLSGFFYIAAVWAWAAVAPGRPGRTFAACAVLFLASLLSKTTTFSLPLAILLLDAWRNGRPRRVTWMMAVGLLLVALIPGIVTLELERSRNVESLARQFTLAERLIVVGKSVWFYAGKLAWPSGLIMIYPIWYLDPGRWQQYVPLALLPVAMAGLWGVRGKIGRGPFFAVLFYLLTLAPIPFLDINFVLQHAFVADHFQYLPSLSLCALGGAGLDRLMNVSRFRWLAVIPSVIVALLGTVSWRLSTHYENPETLWRRVLEHNPGAPVAWNNVGVHLSLSGRTQEAIDAYLRGIALEPRFAKLRLNLAADLVRIGRFDEAIRHYRQALSIESSFVGHNNLAALYARLGRNAEAVSELRKALAEDPDQWEGIWNLGLYELADGRTNEAFEAFAKALALQPNRLELRWRFARIAVDQGRAGEVREFLRTELDRAPQDRDLRLLLVSAETSLGNLPAARTLLEEGVRQHPRDVELLYRLAEREAADRNYVEAAALYERALSLDRGSHELMNNLAWILATATSPEGRNGSRAVEVAERAAALAGRPPAYLDTLAAAYAETGRFDDAGKTVREGIDRARAEGNEELAQAMEPRAALYAAGKAYRDAR